MRGNDVGMQLPAGCNGVPAGCLIMLLPMQTACLLLYCSASQLHACDIFEKYAACAGGAALLNLSSL